MSVVTMLHLTDVQYQLISGFIMRSSNDAVAFKCFYDTCIAMLPCSQARKLSTLLLTQLIRFVKNFLLFLSILYVFI